MNQLDATLHDGQLTVATDQHRFRVICAGRRWGKSTLAQLVVLDWATRTPGTYWIVSPTYRQGKQIHWRGLQQLIPRDWITKKNEVDLSLTLRNGSVIELKGAENPDALRGVKLRGLVIDEIASIRNWDWLWQEALRYTLADYQAPAIFISTPKGYNHFYDLFQLGQVLDGTESDYRSWRFTTYDNPFISADEIEKTKAELDDTTFRQECLAVFTTYKGQVYSDWDMQARYRPFEYDANLPLHLSWDFGINDPTAILFLQPYGNELRLVDYYEASNANIEHFSQYIASLGYKTPSLETGDVAGRAQELVSGKSPVTELARLGHHVRTTGIPNIPVQVRNAHHYIPRLYVSSSNPRVTRFRDCLLNYRYPDVKNPTAINQSNEIPIHDEYSHAMRAFEYYCWNVAEQTRSIDTNPPPRSFAAYIKRKEEEKALKGEYVGY